MFVFLNLKAKNYLQILSYSICYNSTFKNIDIEVTASYTIYSKMAFSPKFFENCYHISYLLNDFPIYNKGTQFIYGKIIE